jgi:hypothetical protein
MSELFGIGSFLSQHLCSPLARSALAGAAGASPGEDSSPSRSRSALSTQDRCGAIARRRRPVGTRNESTGPEIAASRLCSGRIAGIESAAADGNDHQPRYDTPAGEDELGPSPGREGAGPGGRRLGLAEAAAVRTMLMDLERQRVVDVLPVRSAGSIAEWLRLHPGVEMITRDRCGLYAEGGEKARCTFSVYCSTEKAVYTLTVNAE